MKNIAPALILFVLLLISFEANTESAQTLSGENKGEAAEVNAEASSNLEPRSIRQENDSKIGNVEIGNKCVRLFIENANLQVGDKVQIVLPQDFPQRASQAEIIEKSDCKDEYFGELSGNNSRVRLTLYQLKLSDKNDINRGFGIGIVNTDNKVKIAKGLAIVDLNDDKKIEYFRECTSNEGVHLTVWIGKPLKGKRIWHSYYHFSYDTDPTCQEKDYENTDGERQDINSKIGIADQYEDGICFRTKNGDLAENTAVSIVNSLYGPQTALNAKVAKKLEEKCSRRSSELTDRNPGENHYYSLVLTDKVTEEYLEVYGIGIIEPEKPVRIKDGLASIDLNNDGKDEFFRRCAGDEGILLAIWTGKPLKGKQIWHSFYYLDYNIEPNCKKKDWEDIDDDNGERK